MTIMDKKTIISLMSARKIVLICFILASLILAIANSNIESADASKSADSGDIEFIRQFGTSDVDAATDVFADSSEGVYVVGFTDDTLPDQTSQGGRDAFIRKYNSDGDEIWTRQFGTSNPETANGVSGDSSGVYVVGLQHDNDIGFGDAFIRKYNSDGDEIWTRQFGTSDNDEARGVSADSSGVYVAGVTSGEFPGESSSGDADIFVRKYNSDGDEIWTRQFGTSELDFVGKVQGGGGISVDSSGVYVAGQTSGGTFPDQTSEGDVDAFLAKLAIDDHKMKHNDDKMKDHHDDDTKKKL
jgi:Beta-propeller repeat